MRKPARLKDDRKSHAKVPAVFDVTVSTARPASQNADKRSAPPTEAVRAEKEEAPAPSAPVYSGLDENVTQADLDARREAARAAIVDSAYSSSSRQDGLPRGMPAPTVTPPAPPPPRKDNSAEHKSLWLTVYSNEYQRQIPLCGSYGGACDHKEAARRARACADAMIAELQELEEEKLAHEKALEEEARIHAVKRARLVGPAELIESPLLGAHHLADLDHVDEVAAALSTQMTVYERQITEFKQSFEKRIEVLEAESRASRIERAARSIDNAVPLRKRGR